LDDSSTDLELLRLIAQQDLSAHRTMFDRYYRRVFGLVRRRLNDESLAEEVVADVFFEIWRNAAAFRGAARVSTWIFGIAHYKSLTAVRKRQSKRVSSVIPTKVETLHQFAAEGDVEDDMDSRDALRDTLRAIDELPDGQREALRLSVLEGWSYTEVAEHLGVSENTIKTRVSRARARLKATVPTAFAGLRA
jgi:RNA polymerase sigma-70 factor (ECF subfamily)